MIKLFKKTTSKPEYYTTCSELPLYNFIKVTVTGDLNWLVKSGKADSTLQSVWEQIFIEYCDLAPSASQQYVTNITRDIKVIELKLHIIQAIVDKLSREYIPELIEMLRDWGFFFEYSEESLLSDLEATVLQARSLLVQKQVKEGEFKKYQESQSGNETSEYDYDKTLSVLSKFQGYQLRSKDLTVTEFVAIFNQFKEHNKPHGEQPADR